MQFPPGLLHTLEQAITRLLRMDPDAMARMTALAGRCIGIELQPMGIRFYIQPDPAGIRITEHAEQVDTMLHGTPLSLARLGLAGDIGKTLFTGDVTITGDVETGQSFKAILDAVDIDWEEQLSRITGDVVAHQAGNAVRRLRDALQSGSLTLQQDLGEYFREELRIVPSRIEIENLAGEISQLRTDTDRLEARIRRLQQGQEH